MQRKTFAERAAHWSSRHRRVAIGGWLALVILAIALSAGVGLQTLADEDLGNGESRKADQILADAGFADRATEQVLIQPRSPGLTVDDPAFRAAIADTTERLSQIPTITDLKSPLQPANAGQISRDRASALVVFDIRGDSELAEDRVDAILDEVAALDRAHPQLRIEEFGDASANKALSQAFEDDLHKAERLSLPITLLILVVAFGALVAAAIPLVLGLSAVIIAIGLLAPISTAVPVDEAISSVILLIGLAVGVDYSLFYIRRERDERGLGRTPEGALALAAATSGRAVLVSGCTVMVAMAGMYITGNATFASFATGTILVVAVAMVGSLTVLPALLSKLGDNIDRGRVPFRDRLHKPGPEHGAWATIVDGVLRHPWVSVVLAGGLLVLLAVPTLRLHTANSGVQGLPRDLPVMQTYDRIEKAFPGGPLPAVIAVKAPRSDAVEVTAAIRDMRNQAVRTGQMQDPVTVTHNADRTVAQVSVPLAGDGTDDVSNAALRTLREDIIPRTLLRVPGVEAPVTGLTAGSLDFNDQMRARAPWVFAFVLSLAFLLLMVTFRSIVIPLKAIVLNLLSVGAAYGVLVLIFQDGRLESLIGFHSIGGITSWLPLFLFVILFGLSMDYHVFILTRVREGYDNGMPTEEAIAHGIRATAGVVTSAAIVMVAVFGVFATLSSIDFKEMGIGLAVAVLIDATIVRAVLLPASMKLLGDWNWYLPRWLEWLPRVSPEAALARTAAGEVDATAPGVLEIRTDAREDATRLVLRGELDLETVPSFEERLREAETADAVLIDLRAVTFLDSAGVGALLAAHRRARAADRRLVLVRGDHTRIAQVLHTTAMDRTVEIADTPAGAGFGSED